MSQQLVREATAQVRRRAAGGARGAEARAQRQGAAVARTGPSSRREVRHRTEPLCESTLLYFIFRFYSGTFEETVWKVVDFV